MNDLLITIDYQLVIAIEDIDRNNDAEKASNELAALLDKLKLLSNIHFIIAFGTITEKIAKLQKL